MHSVGHDKLDLECRVLLTVSISLLLSMLRNILTTPNDTRITFYDTSLTFRF